MQSACREFGVSYEKENALPNGSWRILAELLNTIDGVKIVADRIGVTRQRVDQVLHEAKALGIGGLSPRMTKQTRDRNASIASVAEMAVQGLTAAKISETLNVSTNAVSKWAIDGGTPVGEFRSSIGRKTFGRIIAELQNTDDGNVVIGVRLGIDAQYVASGALLARQCGIKIPKRALGRRPAKPI